MIEKNLIKIDQHWVKAVPPHAYRENAPPRQEEGKTRNLRRTWNRAKMCLNTWNGFFHLRTLRRKKEGAVGCQVHKKTFHFLGLKASLIRFNRAFMFVRISPLCSARRRQASPHEILVHSRPECSITKFH